MLGLKYNKLWSDNPRKWRTITQRVAGYGYIDYIKKYILSGYNLKKLKTFEEWLKTEI